MAPFIKLFGCPFPTYGLCVLAGGLAGLLAAWRIAAGGPASAGSSKGEAENAVYIYVMGAVGAICGAKALYLATVLPVLARDLPLLATEPALFVHKHISSGFVLYGGLAGGALAAKLTARQHKAPLSRYYPALLPALALACGIGRIGCFLAGCCYGVEAPPGCPIAVVFPPGSAAPSGVPLVPTQLIEAAFDLLLAPAILLVSRRPRLAPLALHIHLIAYSAMRFVLEFHRGDAIRGFWLGLSTSQWAAIAVLAAALADIAARGRKLQFPPR